MAADPSWRLFRRMQDSLVLVAALTYAGCALYAWRVLPGAPNLKTARLLVIPGLCLALSLVAPLAVAPLRGALSRHLLNSYRAGFGQSAISVLGGVLVLIALAGVILWQTHGAVRGGRWPGAAFSGYGAGVGLLLAQAILVRRLERP